MYEKLVAAAWELSRAGCERFVIGMLSAHQTRTAQDARSLGSSAQEQLLAVHRTRNVTTTGILRCQ